MGGQNQGKNPGMTKASKNRQKAFKDLQDFVLGIVMIIRKNHVNGRYLFTITGYNLCCTCALPPDSLRCRTIARMFC